MKTKVKQRYIKLVKLHDSTKKEMEVLQNNYDNLKIETEKGLNKQNIITIITELTNAQ